MKKIKPNDMTPLTKHFPSWPYMRPGELANFLNQRSGHEGWDEQKVRRILQRNGCAVKRPSHWFTTLGMMRDKLPEIVDELLKVCA